MFARLQEQTGSFLSPSGPLMASFCIFLSLGTFQTLICAVGPAWCWLINQARVQARQDNFPSWHRLLGIYSIFQIIWSIFVTFRWTLWIDCRLQLLPYTSMISSCAHHMPTLFLSWTPTYATLICAFKQSKGKGFHKSPVENLSIEMHLSGPYLILFLHSSHLNKFQWLIAAQHFPSMGQFWRRCF